MIHGDVSADLIRTIFAPRTALHDGARDHPRRDDPGGRRPPAAGRDDASTPSASGPATGRPSGIAEQTDAVVIVVSEENGQISLVERSRIVRNLNEAQLARTIRHLLDPNHGRRRARRSAVAVRAGARRPPRPHGPRGDPSPRGPRPQLAPQARGDRSRDAAVRRPRAVPEHRHVHRRRPGRGPRPAGRHVPAHRRSDPVTEIRYFSPSGRAADHVRLRGVDRPADVEPGSGAAERARSSVESIDPRITVLGFEPRPCTVELDKVAPKTVPVTGRARRRPGRHVELGADDRRPDRGRGPGPASVLERGSSPPGRNVIDPAVRHRRRPGRRARARSTALGDAVAQVKRRAGDRARHDPGLLGPPESKTLPVSPQVTGDPAAGFELIGGGVGAAVRDRRGRRRRARGARSAIDTAPIPIGGLSAIADLRVALALPDGVVALDVQSVPVSVGVRAVTATRSFEVGAAPRRRAARTRPTRVDVDRVLITVGGCVADLDRLIGATLAVDSRRHRPSGRARPTSRSTADLPPGVALVSASPARVSSR